MTDQYILRIMKGVLERIESGKINTTCAAVLQVLAYDEKLDCETNEQFFAIIMKRFGDFLEGEPQLLKTCLPKAFRYGQLHPGQAWWKSQKADPDRVTCIRNFINDLSK